jgi:hypothetical protein
MPDTHPEVIIKESGTISYLNIGKNFRFSIDYQTLDKMNYSESPTRSNKGSALDSGNISRDILDATPQLLIVCHQP